MTQQNAQLQNNLQFQQGTGQQPAQNGTQTQMVSQNPTALKRMSEETVGQVLSRVNAMQESGELVMPNGYNAGNALKSAWLYLQGIENGRGIKAIDTCTKESICDCLLQMCVNGEYPMRHFYLIPYGNKLTFQERYLGKLMRTKRDTDVVSVNAQCVYENDKFVFTVDDLGRYQLVTHETSLDNIDIKKIKAAYAIVKYKDGDKRMVVMTYEQIMRSWEQSPTGGKSKAHTNFSDEMCKRTVINRACKMDVDSAPDGAYRVTSESEDDDFSMLPPDASEAERALANSGGSRAALPNSRPDAFEATAEYEDVTDAAPANAMPAPKAPTAKGRECPV